MKKLSKKDIPQIVATLKPHVEVLLLATTVAQMERERVDKIEHRVINEQCYYGRERTREGAGGLERITNPKWSYLMDEQSGQAYCAKLKAIHLADGFAEAAEGKCPALVAEHDQRKAEWALLEASEPFFGCTNDQLLCGISGKSNGLDTRKRFLDLLIGLVVNYPGAIDTKAILAQVAPPKVPAAESAAAALQSSPA